MGRATVPPKAPHKHCLPRSQAGDGDMWRLDEDNSGGAGKIHPHDNVDHPNVRVGANQRVPQRLELLLGRIDGAEGLVQRPKGFSRSGSALPNRLFDGRCVAVRLRFVTNELEKPLQRNDGKQQRHTQHGVMAPETH